MLHFQKFTFMKKLFYIFALVAFTFTSCEKNDENSQIYTNINTSEDYLKFANSATFLEYLKSLEPQNDSNSNYAKVKGSVSKVLIPDNFRSITQIIKDIEKNEISQISKIKSTNQDEIEEMTVDEYNIMLAKDLLQDPILCNVMDTTLRIGIGGYLYKITKDGTFFCPYSKEAELIEIIKNFNEIKKNLILVNNS